MLFSYERTHKLQIPSKDEKGAAVTVAFLIEYLCKNVMRNARQEMFVLDNHV